MAQSDINNAGEKWVCNNGKICYCIGAYNLGPVYEFRAAEAAIHPGEIINHATGAGGEDGYILAPDSTPLAYGVAEIDFSLVSSCATDMASGDNIPGIAFHLHPGAILRNVVCDDFTADFEPDEALTMNSGVAGALQDVIGTDPIIMKSCYFVTDPGGASTQVCYVAIVGGAL